MNASRRAASTRIAVFLLLTWPAAFAWEASKSAHLTAVIGQVVDLRPVPDGGRNDRALVIRYRIGDETHELVTRRYILDLWGALGNARRGDSVPVAVDTRAPGRAVLDTVSGRYPITLIIASVVALFAATLAIIAVRETTGSPRAPTGRCPPDP